jgi:hypothetical protein
MFTRIQQEQRKAGRIEWLWEDPGICQVVPVPEDIIANKGVLKLHSRLQKVEHSVLVQARTSRIRLVKFLYNRKVPGVLSTQYRCGGSEETPKHIVLFCTDGAERRQQLRTGCRIYYQQLIGTNSEENRLAEWMIRSGRLGQFSLASRLLYS